MKHDYSDEEIVNAYAKVMAAKPALEPVHFRLRAFLAALPAAEDTPPAKVDPYAELKAAHADGKVIQVNIGKWGNPEAEDMWEDREDPAWDIEPEFYRIKPEPAADATTIAKCAINNTEQNVQFRATAGYGTWGAADPEPAAQVPLVALDQDDFKPGTWIEYPDGTRGEVSYTRKDSVKVGTFIGELSYSYLREKGCRMNTSIPDTGRWDKDAWRLCSKPAGKEVAK